MTDPSPFIEQETGAVDTDHLRKEAVPLAKLIGLFTILAIVPFAIGSALVGSGIGVLFVVTGQFILAVGTGLVLMYIISRAISLSD